MGVFSDVRRGWGQLARILRSVHGPRLGESRVQACAPVGRTAADLGQRAHHSPSRVLPPPFLMYTIQTANLFFSSLAQNDRRGPDVVHGEFDAYNAKVSSNVRLHLGLVHISAPREMSQEIRITALVGIPIIDIVPCLRLMLCSRPPGYVQPSGRFVAHGAGCVITRAARIVVCTPFSQRRILD